MKDTLKVFPEGFKRRVVVSSANVGTGEYETFTQENTTFEDYAQAALASGSIPAVLPPQNFHDMIMMDGGTIWDVNIDSPIEQCYDMGITEDSNIIVDIAICGPSKDGSFEAEKNAINNYMQARQLRDAYHSMNSIQWQRRANPDINYRYLFNLQEPTTGKQLLDFNNSTTWELQEQGRQDASDMLKLGEGKAFEALDDWMDDKDDLQKKWNSFSDYLRSLVP